MNSELFPLNASDSINLASGAKETISLVIPVYNEAEHLHEFLRRIDALVLPAEKELVIVDDCSRDRSREILQSFSFKSSVQILLQEFNQGKGAALQRGISAARGKIIGIQDADFEYDMEDIAKLVQPILQNKADIVYGSRFTASSNQVHRTFHFLVNRLLTLISNFASGIYLSDMETCYKFFRAEIIQNIVLESNRFGFEPEVTAKVARLKCHVFELPISYFPRNYLEGKKITWKDGLAALWHILHFNILKDKRQFFKAGLPERYVPKGAQWL